MMNSMGNVNRWITKLASRMHLDGRRGPRVPTNPVAVLSGPQGTNGVRCVEISRGGATVMVEQPVEVGTLVFLRLPNLGLMGFAHVRHCRAEGEGQRIGLQFRDGLTREREAVDGAWRREQATSQLAWDEPAY
jgi:hypothetical protein